MSTSQQRTIVVGFWAEIFRWLGFVSLFSVVGLFVPRVRSSYLFVDVWVMGHTALAFIVAVIATVRIQQPVTLLLQVAVSYGALRVFEIVVYQLNVMLFDEYRLAKSGKTYALRGYLRIVLLVLHNYVEILLWFTTAYVLAARSGFVELGDFGFFSVFRQSLLFMVALSGDAARPIHVLGVVLVLVQSGVGVLMTIIVLSQFLSLLPAPASIDQFEIPGEARLLGKTPTPDSQPDKSGSAA